MTIGIAIIIGVFTFILGICLGMVFGRRNTIPLPEHRQICEEREALHRQANENLMRLQQSAVEQARAIARDTLENAQARFSELSEKILHQRAAELESGNARNVTNVMKPYEARLEEFKSQIISLRDANAKFQGTILSFNNTSNQLRNQTENLTRALCSGQKSQGLFGERQLANILASSGLTRNSDYWLQTGIPGGDSDSNTFIPDATIKLPASDAILVVDSKASFTAFMEALNADDDASRDAALKKHLLSLQKHIRELNAKRYADEYRKRTGSDAVDTVFMFVPSDHALLAALEHHPELWREAVENGVLLVCPSTLLVAIHIVDIGWRRVEFNRNTDAILAQAQKLLENISDFLTFFDNVGKNLEEAQKSWLKARNKLLPTPTGKTGSIADAAKQLCELGIKQNPKKRLPREINNAD